MVDCMVSRTSLHLTTGFLYFLCSQKQGKCIFPHITWLCPASDHISRPIISRFTSFAQSIAISLELKEEMMKWSWESEYPEPGGCWLQYKSCYGSIAQPSVLVVLGGANSFSPASLWENVKRFLGTTLVTPSYTPPECSCPGNFSKLKFHSSQPSTCWMSFDKSAEKHQSWCRLWHVKLDWNSSEPFDSSRLTEPLLGKRPPLTQIVLVDILPL